MVQVEFQHSGEAALRQLPTDVQDTVVSTLDDLDSSRKDRSKVLKNDEGGKYHYFTLEKGKYIVVVDLDRSYGGREDEVTVVDMGLKSDFLIDD
jgi:mRNA-degrading endonuclease RelE of RelBE toxin-antitoxin system